MRLSNGTDITYGADYLGPAIIMDGDLSHNVETGAPVWRKGETGNQADTRHIWRLPKAAMLERTTNNCPVTYLTAAKNALDKLTASPLHPALTYGFVKEGRRLFPDISTASNEKYISFIADLKSRYGISESEEREKIMGNFVDDIGPTILTLIDGEPTMLPEIPPVYKAPANWLGIMWNINNHMTGPFLEPGIADSQKIQFAGLPINTTALSDWQRGLYYFHMTRFILIFEAWIGDPAAPHLMEFIRLIERGVDPFGNK